MEEKYDELYAIKKILNRKVVDEKVSYLVSWKNLPETENTWIELEDLNDENLEKAHYYDKMLKHNSEGSIIPAVVTFESDDVRMEFENELADDISQTESEFERDRELTSWIDFDYEGPTEGEIENTNRVFRSILKASNPNGFSNEAIEVTSIAETVVTIPDDLKEFAKDLDLDYFDENILEWDSVTIVENPIEANYALVLSIRERLPRRLDVIHANGESDDLLLQDCDSRTVVDFSCPLKCAYVAGDFQNEEKYLIKNSSHSAFLRCEKFNFDTVKCSDPDCDQIFRDKETFIMHVETHYEGIDVDRLELLWKTKLFEKYHESDLKIIPFVSKRLDPTMTLSRSPFSKSRQMLQLDSSPFSQQSAYRKEFHKASVFRCLKCDPPKTFATRALYSKHHNSEHKASVFRCMNCDPPKTFATQALYRKHHNSEHKALFRCMKCDPPKTFATQALYSKHHNSEHKASVFRCLKCDPPKTFATRALYRKHRNSEHKALFRCMKCDPPKTFATQALYSKHHISEHKSLFRCLKCDPPKTFATRALSDKHRNSEHKALSKQKHSQLSTTS